MPDEVDQALLDVADAAALGVTPREEKRRWRLTQPSKPPRQGQSAFLGTHDRVTGEYSPPAPDPIPRFVPPRPTGRDIALPPAPKLSEEELVRLVELTHPLKVECGHCGKWSDVSGLARLEAARAAWIERAIEIADEQWKRHPAVIAQAAAEAQYEQERRAEVREARETAWRRHQRAERVFGEMVASGVPVAEATAIVRREYPDEF